MTTIALPALTAFAVSLLLVRVCRALAVRWGYVANPRADRWHAKPTALFGGVGIALTVFIVYGALVGFREAPMLLAGAAVIFGVGLVDDLIGLKPYTRLIAEIAVASAYVFFGYRLAWVESLTLDAMLTMFWIVGLTNAFNLLDNMDGLSGGISIIAGSALLASLALNHGPTSDVLYLASLLGAIGGFLVYNFHPASVFMGDSGSLFIGLSLAVLTLASPYGTHASSNVLSIVIGPLMIAMVPIFDTTLVTVSRILSGRSAAQGGRDHSSHRLVAMGLSERGAVAVLWSLAALGGVLALAIRGQYYDWANIPAAIFALAMIIFAVYLAHVRVYDVDASDLRTGQMTPFVINFVYRRRVAEVLLDLCLISLAYYSAYRLRFGGPALSEYFQMFLQSLPLIVGIQMVSLYAVGAYRGVWRHFGLMDGVTFAKGVALGSTLSVLAILFLYRFENYSRGVFVIDAVLLMVLLCGSRASFRLMTEFAQRRSAGGERCVVYGTGSASLATIREAFGDRPLRILGFVDDDPGRRRMSLGGYSVLGDFAQLMGMVERGELDCVVLNTRIIDVDRLRAIEAACQDHSVDLLMLHINVQPFTAAS